MTTYSYRSQEQKGTITLLDHHADCDIRQTFSRWRYQIPYWQLTSHPIRNVKTTQGFWACVAVGVIGVIASAIRLIGFDHSMPLSFAIPIFIASIGLLLYSTRIRTEHWVSFHSIIPNVSIYYCESGPNSDTFEQFTNTLTNKIATSSRSAESAV